ncbi:MAG TPA: hypothetical protein PK918_10230 [Methanotrichaceae archaeon]|nr:hypothetical protein [Methanotrichaceae archaeon]HQI92305.1 hypothetical protein [Methanotrichaceae archaeon]
MRLLIGSIALLFLAMNSSAVQQNLTLGQSENQYNVTFDLDPCVNCTVSLAETIENPDSTLYSFLIDFENASCMVWMEEWDQLQDATISLRHANFEMMKFCDSCTNVSVEMMNISGKEAKVARGTSVDDGSVWNMAAFWLDSIPCDCGPVSVGKTYVEIASDLPENTTENFLNTLKFER